MADIPTEFDFADATPEQRKQLSREIGRRLLRQRDLDTLAVLSGDPQLAEAGRLLMRGGEQEQQQLGEIASKTIGHETQADVARASEAYKNAMLGATMGNQAFNQNIEALKFQNPPKQHVINPETGQQAVFDPRSGTFSPVGGAGFSDPRALEMMRRKKFLTAEQQNELSAAETSLTPLQEVMALVRKNPDAFGAVVGLASKSPIGAGQLTRKALGFTGAPVDQGQLVRSRVFEMASQVIHKLSGAATSKTEQARIEQFNPADTDDARTILVKLQGALDSSRSKYNSIRSLLPGTPGAAPDAGAPPLPAGPVVREPGGAPAPGPAGDPMAELLRKYGVGQ